MAVKTRADRLVERMEAMLPDIHEHALVGPLRAEFIAALDQARQVAIETRRTGGIPQITIERMDKESAEMLADAFNDIIRHEAGKLETVEIKPGPLLWPSPDTLTRMVKFFAENEPKPEIDRRKAERPPLGVVPEMIHREERMNILADAIVKNLDSRELSRGVSTAVHRWIGELHRLLGEQLDEMDEKSRPETSRT